MIVALFISFVMALLHLNEGHGNKSQVGSQYNIENILPKGYVKDGSEDYTLYVQQALQQYNKVTFPPFPILVNDNGIMIQSNTTITFLPGSKIILKPSSKGSYSIFKLSNVANVTFNNPVIVGDRNNHLGTKGEWGMGIGIFSSSNITITGAKISDCWGDGIYIGRNKNSQSCRNIGIIRSSVNNNRRDGISIISVDGLTLDSFYAGNSNGTLPMCGINFEPENSTDELQNILLNNPTTERNLGSGIQVGYSNLYGGANKQTNIRIINHTDLKSTIAIKIAANISKRSANETITGTLLLSKPKWIRNAVRPIQTDLFEDKLKMTIISPSVQDNDGRLLSKDRILKLLTYKTSINKGANYILNL